MRRALALLGLVLTSLAVLAGTASARSGSDSSGQHSYSLTCHTFTNTGAREIFLHSDVIGAPGIGLQPGDSIEVGGMHWEVAFADPPGSLNHVVFDSGMFNEDECAPEPTTPTTQPTTPPEPTIPPNTPGLTPGQGANSDVAPGEVTIGAAGFAPGESVTATLFSTPRPLGTVVADAGGTVSVTFTISAADGAGLHHVVFEGPSGTVSVPFTLVVPEGTEAPSTTAPTGQLPTTL
jgi:hypothetical protein